MTDAALTSDYDIQFDATGELLTADSLDTAIVMSLFCERRASASEVPESHRRRGWIGNEVTPGFEIGSKLWLYEQARVTRSILLGVQSAVLNGLAWMIADDISIAHEATATLSAGQIGVTVTMYRPSSKVDKRYYTLWENTGQ
jgi:phage gp46-like protein